MDLDHSLGACLRGKLILITGGTGSVGVALIERLLRYEPQAIRVFSRDESKQSALQHRWRQHPNLRFLIGDIRDLRRLSRAMAGVDVVFHAAALKHVGACEYNPFEAVQTNVFGTQNVIEAAIDADVERLVFTSSDKAVNPINTMGASKLLAERVITAAHAYRGPRSRTKMCSVRFGNVFGSRGSVVPLFREQILRGGPVTLTSPDMTRYVMSMDEALDLILRALVLAEGGEVFVAKMPVMRVVDLVQLLIEELAARGECATEVPLQVIGPQTGEKLWEEIITFEEMARAEDLPDMYVIRLAPADGVPLPPAAVATRYSHIDPLIDREVLRGLLRQALAAG